MVNNNNYIIRSFPIFEEELHEPGDGGHEDGAELLERHVLLALTHQDVAELVLVVCTGLPIVSGSEKPRI